MNTFLITRSLEIKVKQITWYIGHYNAGNINIINKILKAISLSTGSDHFKVE